MVKQGWANGDNVRARGVGMIRVGALTGGERAPAGDEGGPTRGGGQEEEPRGGLPNLQLSPASWPQTFLQNALGDLNSLANLRHS